MIHSDHLGPQRPNSMLCGGAFTTEQQRQEFVLRNGIDDMSTLCSAGALYGSIGFPFEQVEGILRSTEQLNFLYILVNSPLDSNYRVYDEYVFKNFPNTTALLKQIRNGGDTFVFKKKNRDVLFVKFQNIYEAEPLLHMTLQ